MLAFKCWAREDLKKGNLISLANKTIIIFTNTIYNKQSLYKFMYIRVNIYKGWEYINTNIKEEEEEEEEGSSFSPSSAPQNRTGICDSRRSQYLSQQIVVLKMRFLFIASVMFNCWYWGMS